MSREVSLDISGKEENLGPAAKAYRSIGTNEHTNFDPFLLIDELIIDPDKGLPDHPHRGIESLTYILKGQSVNEDSNGHLSVINQGDIQCITVGKGVMHGIMPTGREPCRSLQLWLNLPKKLKMMEPKYQDIKNADLPKSFKDGVHLKLISGRSNDLKSPLKTVIPTLILEFKLDRGASFTQPIPNEWAAFVYVIEGTGTFGRLKRVEGTAHHTLLLSKGTGISFKNMHHNQLHLILFAGQQLNEPVFRKGPYIMNTQNEIDDAVTDFEQGKNGFEKAQGWRSQAIKRQQQILQKEAAKLQSQQQKQQTQNQNQQQQNQQQQQQQQTQQQHPNNQQNQQQNQQQQQHQQNSQQQHQQNQQQYQQQQHQYQNQIYQNQQQQHSHQQAQQQQHQNQTNQFNQQQYQQQQQHQQQCQINNNTMKK